MTAGSCQERAIHQALQDTIDETSVAWVLEAPSTSHFSCQAMELFCGRRSRSGRAILRWRWTLMEEHHHCNGCDALGLGPFFLACSSSLQKSEAILLSHIPQCLLLHTLFLQQRHTGLPAEPHLYISQKLTCKFSTSGFLIPTVSSIRTWAQPSFPTPAFCVSWDSVPAPVGKPGVTRVVWVRDVPAASSWLQSHPVVFRQHIKGHSKDWNQH